MRSEIEVEGPEGGESRRGLTRGGLLATLLLLAGCSGGGGGGDDGAPAPPDPPQVDASYEVGDVLACVELAAPDTTAFVLRATVPVPPALYPLAEEPDASPFAIRDSAGAEVSAQVEIVSRYPDPEHGADVVEVLASVARPEGVLPGQRITYSVVWSPNFPAAHQRAASVAQLVDAPRSLVLRTHDVFGHPYEADLLTDYRSEAPDDLVVLRDGAVAHQERTHETLLPVTPVEGSTGTVPHLMGVHTYLTTWRALEFVSLDLRVHDGHDGQDPTTDTDDPGGTIYFDSLELVAPTGWTLLHAYPCPTTGVHYVEGPSNVWPIIAPLDGGALHVMHAQEQLERRLVLVREGHEAAARVVLEEQGLAFCRKGTTGEGFELFSWWNAATARYFAQNLPLPDLDYLEPMTSSRNELYDDYLAVHDALRNGVPGPWPVTWGNVGWAHPWGPQFGAMHGGAEIFFWEGVKTAWSASVDGYRLFQMTHRMYTERHPTALYDRHGRPHHLEDWIEEGPNGPYLPTWMWLRPQLYLGDAFGFGDAPTFQVDAVVAQGRTPDYDADLDGFDPIDTQHLTRYLRAPKVLVWLGNDALAKDDLLLQGELCRASYTLLPQKPDGTGIIVGAKHSLDYVEEHPGWGFDIDRGHGWILDAAATAFALGDEAWREEVRPWFVDYVDLVEAGQSTCTGAMQSTPNGNHFGAQYRVLQSISEAIVENALWETRTTVFGDHDPENAARIDSILAASTGAMISPLVWDEVGNVMHFYTALGPIDQELPPFCTYVPPDGEEGEDGWQTWNVFVFGLLCTGDPYYLERARQMAGGVLTVESIGMDHLAGELETRAGMISLLQSLE